MALPNLASSTDLSARGVTATSVHTTMLAVASALVRGAVGGPVLATTSTVTLWALDATQWLPLPGSPVTAVASVVRDGDTLVANDDYKLVDGQLWGSAHWGDGATPVKVVVTLTHGFAAVPSPLVNLVCDLAILGAKVAADGALDPRVVAERIDDYSVQFAKGAEAVAGAMQIPALTRNWLRAQYGGGASMVGSR